jgi:predicted Zn-dependent protease
MPYPRLRTRASVAVLSVLPLVLFAGCSTVAVSERQQLSLVPDSDLLAMSKDQYAQVIAEGPLSRDEEQVERIRRIGNDIRQAVERYAAENNRTQDLQGYEWEFNLIESDQVNAWCMPGGKVAFYTGILPVCQTDDGIAVVMGHEVAHAVAKHGAEKMSQQMVAQFGQQALGALLSTKSAETQAIFMTAYGAGAQYGALLPFSRKMESEADHLGLVFMAMAGYEPEAAVPFWERMAAMKGGSAPPAFTSTHPSDEARIRQIQEWMPEAKAAMPK